MKILLIITLLVGIVNARLVTGGQSNALRANPFFDLLAETLGENIATTGEGGQRLANWVSGEVGSFARNDLYREHFFDGLGGSDVEQHAIVNGYALSEIVAFMWMQGENDSVFPDSIYVERFTALIGFLKEDWGVTDLKLTVMSIQSANVINQGVEDGILINAQLEEIVNTYAGGAELIDTSNMNREDNVHLNRPSAHAVAVRSLSAVYRLLGEEIPSINNTGILFIHR